MLRREKNFILLIYEAHLLGDIRKCLKLLDDSGKYFYIKHDKNDIAPHYHIYYSSNSLVDECQVENLFMKHVASRVYIQPANMGKYPFITYMLQNDEYRMKDIKGTMSLA